MQYTFPFQMRRLQESNEAVDCDSDLEDPEQLLNEWLGELDNLTGVSGNLWRGVFTNKDFHSIFLFIKGL